MDRDKLNTLSRFALDRRNERRFFFKCDDCGQPVDARKLGDVVHHLAQEHEAISA